MNRDELRTRVSGIQWFHTIDLGHGIVIPGVDDTPDKLRRIGMPEDLSGQTVLDIGSWDGFFSFEAERRGAKRALATDSYCWSGTAWGTKKGSDLARQVLDSHIEDRLIDVMDLSPETIGRFDVVLFLGVLYHLRHPLFALEKVASVTATHLILETQVDLISLRRPAMAFYPGTELNNDPTNWWAPNPSALVERLKTVGFSRVAVVSPPEPFVTRIGNAFKQWLIQRKNPFIACDRDRIAVHAWK